MTTHEDAIAVEATEPLSDTRQFMRLPPVERRRILAQQAEQMVEYYEQESLRQERELWQGGDIVEP